MLVEFIFDRKNLRVDAGEVATTLEQELKNHNFPVKFDVKGVTVMSKWLVILVNFPTITEHRDKGVEFLWDALAGVTVLNFDVRYRHFEVHGEGKSLIFKKNWRKKY